MICLNEAHHLIGPLDQARDLLRDGDREVGDVAARLFEDSLTALAEVKNEADPEQPDQDESTCEDRRLRLPTGEPADRDAPRRLIR